MFRQSLKTRSRDYFNYAYSFLPGPLLDRPVFILGCGRSGKSTLARLLRVHPKVVFLNEPRRLWFAAFPQSDIWTSKAVPRNGRLYMSEQDFTPRRARRLSRLFKKEVWTRRGQFVFEELAINNFRVDLIQRIFPDALFIHVYRNGLEVADLIHEAATHGQWFGAGLYKWNRLVEYANRDPRTRDLPALCSDFRDMGLLEWRLSTEAAVESLRKMPAGTYLEIHSDDIMASPQTVTARVCEFVGIDSNQMTMPSISGNGADESGSKPARAPLTDKEICLGGPLLPLSKSSRDGLVGFYAVSADG